jgi:hypothetical protein
MAPLVQHEEHKRSHEPIPKELHRHAAGRHELTAPHHRVAISITTASGDVIADSQSEEKH